jgi:predicted acetyltransferase
MKYTIKTADIKDKPLIYSMLQDYLRDLTQFETIPLNESGEYEYQYLKYYWTENIRYPYLLYCNEDISGFALVRKEEKFFSMAEFSVLPNFAEKERERYLPLMLFINIRENGTLSIILKITRVKNSGIN